MAKCIMIQGTMSNVGKSLLVTALCRIFRQDGYRVAPFKGQNMALNSCITSKGLEMSRAQAVQAEAAGLEPDPRMNPVLLKPSSDTGSQLIVNGRPRGHYQAADYFKLVRYSFSGGASSFAGRPCDLRRFFYLVWECSRRLKDVVVENKDFEELITQYDREDTFFYCDPPYYNAECYEVVFPKSDHVRLHDALAKCKGLVMVSYNYCDFICGLYRDFYIFHTTRPNSMSQTAGSEYEEVVMTNYDPRVLGVDRGWQIDLFQRGEDRDGGGTYRLIHEPIKL